MAYTSIVLATALGRVVAAALNPIIYSLVFKTLITLNDPLNSSLSLPAIKTLSFTARRCASAVL